MKSREEYVAKKNRGRAALESHRLFVQDFDIYDRNEVFDDGILRYRADRAENFSLETALTCLALSSYLRKKFPVERWQIYEETSLAAILKSLSNTNSVELQMLIRGLPMILCLPYPAVNVLRKVVSDAAAQLKVTLRLNNRWQKYVELDYLNDILKLGG